MKNLRKFLHHKSLWILGVLLAMTMTNCLEKDPQIWEPDDISLQIAEYIDLNQEQFSEFYDMILRTDFVHLLKARGPYTLFLPTNDAMKSYYAEKGGTSLDDLTLEQMDKLVRTHLFAYLIPTATIGLGSLPDTNALGDFISTEFSGSDIVIAKRCTIIKRDILNANGYVHVLDKVIDPVTRTVTEVIASDPKYSIFVGGLVKTGLDETLKIISGPYGNTEVRIWYTLFAVPDVVYKANNINTVEDLIAAYDDGEGAINDPGNGFYKYMEYHALDGVYYLSAFRTGVYPVISRENQVSLRVDTAYLINYDPQDSSYVRFIHVDGNVSCKNGVIHAVNDLMPAIDPIPQQLNISVTHFPDLQSEDCYLNYIKNFMDGENDFAKIKWQGDYMQYYYKGDQGYWEHDCLSMSQGFWWLEITIPKTTKGKYAVSGYFKVGENRADMICYIDDVKTDLIVATRFDSKSYMTIPIAEVDWTETTEHSFKFVTLVPGIVYLDRLIFDPIL